MLAHRLEQTRQVEGVDARIDFANRSLDRAGVPLLDNTCNPLAGPDDAAVSLGIIDHGGQNGQRPPTSRCGDRADCGGLPASAAARRRTAARVTRSGPGKPVPLPAARGPFQAVAPGPQKSGPAAAPGLRGPLSRRDRRRRPMTGVKRLAPLTERVRSSAGRLRGGKPSAGRTSCVCPCPRQGSPSEQRTLVDYRPDLGRIGRRRSRRGWPFGAGRASSVARNDSS